MNRSTVISVALVLVGGAFLIGQAVTRGSGTAYVQLDEKTIQTADGEVTRIHEIPVDPKSRNEEGVRLSVSRTVGLWVAALLTLCIFSFLYGDNPLYRLAEAVFIGVSAAYAMVVGFWTEIVENLLGHLFPATMRDWGLAGLDEAREFDWTYVAPLILSVMMLWRLAPVGAWIARWPLAFFIGATAGIRLVAYFESDFLAQIQQTIVPLVVMSQSGVNWETTIRNWVVVVGVLVCLTYFFFSVEHTGLVGRISRLGIWFLMITFGATFAYTVMGRIALLGERLEFLFDDWLWLVDPLSRRAGL